MVVALALAGVFATVAPGSPGGSRVAAVAVSHNLPISAKVRTVGKHKKKKAKKKKSSLPSVYGNVPSGTYQVAYQISIPGIENSGWVNVNTQVLSPVDAADFALALKTFNRTYANECASEGSQLSATITCSESYQTWSGTSFGFSFSAHGTGTDGTSFTETIQVRYTKTS
jgi:hypothetical protein